MTKHTSGPWDIKNKENEFIIVNVQRDRPDYTVAFIPNINKYTQNTANAQLIATAPELLEALKMASDFLNYGEAMHSSKLVYDIIEAAIAKAEGNTN